MTDYNKARDMWAALTHDARRKILAELDADDGERHTHDFAALPPQLHAAIVAGMPVDAPAAPAEEKN